MHKYFRTLRNSTAIRDTFSESPKIVPRNGHGGQSGTVDRCSPSAGAFIGTICRTIFDTQHAFAKRKKSFQILWKLGVKESHVPNSRHLEERPA